MSGLQKIFLKRINKMIVFIFSLVLLMAYSPESIGIRGSKEVVVSNSIPNRTSLKDRLTYLRANNKIMVCAHRGLHLNAPENSLKSITDAINSGIGMVELDIRKTSDNILVLMHDANINRTTNGSGAVSNFSLEQLQQFKLKGKDGTITDEIIPTLTEVLELARGKIYIDLDIDGKAPFSEVYSLVNQYGMLKQVLFYSSELSVIQEMVNLNNDDVLAMPIIGNQSDFDNYSSLNLDVVQFNVNNNSVKQQIQSKSWFIFRNAYVNTGSTTPKSDNYAQLNKVIDANASIVQTDNPIEIECKLYLQNLN